MPTTKRRTPLRHLINETPHLSRIVRVEPKPRFELRLTYDDGAVVVVEFRSVIRRGGVAAPLRDPEFFQRVRVERGGRALAWPGELDFCADALRLCGKPVSPRETLSRNQAKVRGGSNLKNRSGGAASRTKETLLPAGRFTARKRNAVARKDISESRSKASRRT